MHHLYNKNFKKLVNLSLVIIFIVSFNHDGLNQNSRNIKFDRITSENFKIEKGLSQNSAKCILQDSKGYIWIGTWDGLNRFDGYNFITYKSSITVNSNEISNQTINALFEDKNGVLWIGTETGLNSFDRKNQKFNQYKRNYQDPFSISSDTILCIAEESQDIMWIGTNNGLNKFDKRTGYFYHFKLNPNNANSPSNNTINCILLDENANIWFGTNEGLNFFDRKEKIFHHWYANPSNKNSLSSDLIHDLLIIDEKTLWVCTNNGLDLYSLRNKTFSHYYYNPEDPYSISNNNITAIMLDDEKNIWIGTFGGGLNQFNKKTKKFNHFFNDIYNERSLSNDYINSIYQDRSGIIWVATAWKGVNKIDKYSNRFKHYNHSSDDSKSLNNNNVWSIFQDNNRKLWIATDLGINIYDTSSHEFTFMKHIPGNKNSIPSNLTRAIFQDSYNNYWIGTSDAGFCVFHSKNKTFQTFQHNPADVNSLSCNRINFFYEDKNNNIWIGTDYGLNKYLPKTKSFKQFKNDPSDPSSISNNVIYNLIEDTSGGFWISTMGGLNFFNPLTEKFACIKKNNSAFNTLSSDKIFSVYKDRDGVFWIATCGGGLNRFNIETGEIKYFLEENGLSNNVVYNIFEDKSQNLWITTNYGLSRYNKKNQSFINFDAKDGIQSNEFNLNACFFNQKSGELFIGGMNGFNAFIPENIATNSFVPSIVITSFKIFDKTIPIEINDGDTILLLYEDNFFSFEFASLDFSNPSKNKYAIILENFDDSWKFSDAYKHFTGYTKVSPGIYHFRVKGSNCDGVWNEKGISVTIIISTPWWQKLWFRFLIFVIVIATIWFFIHNRLRTIRIKHQGEMQILEIEKQMFSLEQTALRLQMNPHFIFNSLNSIQSFVIYNNTDKAIHYLAKFSQLMRFILSHSQQPFVPINDEIKAMGIYLDIEQLRFDNKFTYFFSIDPDIDLEYIEIPPMIIQPYVENAIIHGILNKEGKGTIKISIKQIDEKFLLCTVEDDGIGREKSIQLKDKSDLKHKSRGMLITQKRLEILNERNPDHLNVKITDLKDEKNTPCGTKVDITIIYKET